MVITDSGNGLLFGWYQAITTAYDALLAIVPLWTNLIEIWINNFFFKEILL